MITELDEVAAVLAGTPLADRPIGHGRQGAIVIHEVPTRELLDAWRAAYRLVPATGRWPVLITAWGDLPELQPHPDPAVPTAAQMSAFDERAHTTDPWSHFRSWRDDEPVDADDLAWMIPGGPHDLQLAEVLAAVELPTTQHLLERWIYERVLSDTDLTARIRGSVRYVAQTDSWYTPDNVQLLLLPTACSWLAPKWVWFYGAASNPEELAAVLWQWDQRWGARLVACWDTMLQFIVERPPAPGEEAWTLAGQIKALARNLDMDRWELAVALSEGDAWFIHHRP